MAQTPRTWVVGWEDAVGWSRVAQPAQHSWGGGAQPLRWQELERPKADHEPNALACYGLLVRHHPTAPEQMLGRFVTGRPVSAITTAFLAECSAQLAAQGVTAVLLGWAHASWHPSQAVRTWVRTQNQSVKRTGQGVRIVPCRLPVQSPWLNPIEPTWVHGKRAVSEPARLLSADELEARVCAYYDGTREAHLVMPKQVA